jgi:riboflavin kinase/FMN adenylyltransferase
VTFQRHPTEILLHDNIPGFIMSTRQKRHSLREMGVDVSVLIDFTEEFRRLPGSEFLDRLAASFQLRRIVVGHDFRCGYRLDTDIDAIRARFAAADVDVIEVEPVSDGEEPVSSTRVRDLILAGEIGAAGRLLGRPFALDVTDEEIEQDAGRAYIVKGRSGLLPESRQLVPPPGRYDVDLVCRDGESNDTPGAARRSSILDIGENSLSWALAPGETIRYIELKERR